jgi:hypothetical protein
MGLNERHLPKEGPRMAIAHTVDDLLDAMLELVNYSDLSYKDKHKLVLSACDERHMTALMEFVSWFAIEEEEEEEVEDEPS